MTVTVMVLTVSVFSVVCCVAVGVLLVGFGGVVTWC